MVSASDFEYLLIILIFGVLGIIMAMFVRELYINQIIISEAIQGTITITRLMAFIIIFFLFIGAVIGAFKK